jgi:hypothetical protein
MVGPLLEHIIESAGGEAAKQILTKAFKKLFKETDRKLKPAEESQLKKEVESLVLAATFDDVKEFDPKFRMIRESIGTIHAMKAPSKRSAKKKPDSYRTPTKRAPTKKSVTSKTSAKRATTKKTSPRRQRT